MSQADDGDTPPSPAPTEVEPMLAEAIREATSAATDRKVAVSLDVHADARLALVDRRLVVQAVDALVRNGIRFTPDGGSVTVRAVEESEDLLVEVKDTGIGLSREARHRLFDQSYVKRDSRYHRTARGLEFNVAGLGFGLALARRVVESHGGRMHVEGEEGRGCIFTLRFPGAVPDAEPQRAAA